jgi:hexokinase
MAQATLQKHHPLNRPPTITELYFIRSISQLVSRRAAAYLAAGIHALWCLRTNAEGLEPADAGHTVIACNGAVIEKYPSFKSNCQATLDNLIDVSGGQHHSVVLEDAIESAIFGAAVAVTCLGDD